MYQSIRDAYVRQWGKPVEEEPPRLPPALLKDFPGLSILRFPPSRFHPVWIDATLGMGELSNAKERVPEVHIYSPERSDAVMDALSAIMESVQYEPLEYGRVFPCVRDENSEGACTHLLACYPEAEGEGFPEVSVEGKEVQFMRLVPITNAEVRFLEQNGYDALENRLESPDGVLYRWNRDSVV